MDVIFDNTELRNRIISQFKAIKAFAEAVGMSASRISNRLSNRTDFTCEEIITWAEVLGLNGNDVQKLFFTVR